MRRPAFILALAMTLAAVAPAPAAADVPTADVERLDARIEVAQARIERWYGRIERWYRRIDLAARRVERLEERAERAAAVVDRVAELTSSTPRRVDPASRLRLAARQMRRVQRDPLARRAQAELDTWTAYLAELLRARERATRPAPDASPTASSATASRGPLTYERWARALLGRLGAPGCSDNLTVVVTWETAESTSARYNPLATTRDVPGSTDMNEVGVKHFRSLDQGLDASRDTLLQGAPSYLYDAIVELLRGCAPAEQTAAAINASAWCRGCVGGSYVTGLLPIVRASYDEHAARLVATA